MESIPVLSLGSRNPWVYRIGNILQGKNYTSNPETDGLFDSDMKEAVIRYQREHGLDIDGVVGKNTWESLGIGLTKHEPEYLILHTTASPRTWTAQNVEAYHKSLGWGRPGYSKVIEPGGNVVELWPIDYSDGFQPMDEYTNGAAELNPYSIHISYIGGITPEGKAIDNRDENQKGSMEKIVKEVIAAFPTILVGGHNQFHNKACPCFWVPTWLKSIGVEQRNIYEGIPFPYYKNLFS